MDGYGNLIAARLRKLAAARRTGVLPFTGDNDGAIYFSDGGVTGAECRRTPPGSGLEPGPGLEPATLAGPRRLPAIAGAVEPVVDAALELLSSDARYGKFRSASSGFAGSALPVDDLLAEVARRQRLLRQLAGVLGADTTVVRNPSMAADRIRVSALQWALLIRVGDGATPRDLAWQLGRSVFGTTIEVYRLLALRLLSAPGHSDGAWDLSFVQAVAIADKEGKANEQPA